MARVSIDTLKELLQYAEECEADSVEMDVIVDPYGEYLGEIDLILYRGQEYLATPFESFKEEK